MFHSEYIVFSSHQVFQLERHTHMLAIEDKGPTGLHHWNAAGVSFRTSVCVCGAGVRAVPPLRKPFKARQDCRNQPRIFPSLTRLQRDLFDISHDKHGVISGVLILLISLYLHSILSPYSHHMN